MGFVRQNKLVDSLRYGLVDGMPAADKAPRDETADWLLDDFERVGGFTVEAAINADQPVMKGSAEAPVLVLLPPEQPINAGVAPVDKQ